MNRVNGSTGHKLFRVNFTDGNERLLEGSNMHAVLSYLLFEENIGVTTIWRIEEVNEAFLKVSNLKDELNLQ